MTDRRERRSAKDFVDASSFVRRVWEHYKTSGRHDMPWRQNRDPYRIVVSEIMLQQTQVSRVTPRFLEFVELFPDVFALAASPLSAVISSWTGLGYNRRARFLHETAKRIVQEHAGRVPQRVEELRRLPGIGPNTAASITCFAYDTHVVFIETNIRRAFIYEFFSEEADPAAPEPSLFGDSLVAEKTGTPVFLPRVQRARVDDAELFPLIEQTLDYEQPREWYYALMDYGSELARYVPNPNRASRHYVRQSTFEGSRRQIRGRIIRALSGARCVELADLVHEAGVDKDNLADILDDLQNEGLVAACERGWCLAD